MKKPRPQKKVDPVAAKGAEPTKPFTFKIPVSLLERVKDKARAEFQSAAGFCCKTLEAATK